MQKFLEKLTSLRLKIPSRTYSFAATSFFFFLYLGVPFSISDSGQVAWGNGYKDYVRSVELLTNEHSDTADFSRIDKAM